MYKKKLEQIIGPTVKKNKVEQLYQTCGSFRPLSELLVEWMDRKEVEWAKFKRENSVNSTQTMRGGD